MKLIILVAFNCALALVNAESSDDLLIGAGFEADDNDALFERGDLEDIFSSASAAINASESDNDIMYNAEKGLRTPEIYSERSNMDERALYIGEGCDMVHSKRESCPGITQDSCSINCHTAGCCYDDTAPDGVLKCFKRAKVRQFTITAKTGTVQWANSNNNQYIRLIGTTGRCDEIRLDGPFQSGSTRSFDIDCGTYIGILKELTVRIDGTDGWYIETIDVSNTFGDSETFKCNKFVDEYETISCGYCASLPCQNGGTCTQTLVGYKCECDPGYIGTNCQTERNYRISMTTATSPYDANSDALVYLIMVGNKGQCTEALLDTPANDMEKGNTDHHYIACGTPIGDLTELRFRSASNDRWLFTTVAVQSSQGIKTYQCNMWVNINAPATCVVDG